MEKSILQGKMCETGLAAREMMKIRWWVGLDEPSLRG
jgi:hypothetical protein